MSWEALEHVVSPRILANALATSERLRHLGIPHALVGGLAVGIHGHPRATRDVDFLVGPEAFVTTQPLSVFRPELISILQLGAIDLLAALPDDPLLAGAIQLPGEGELPVVSIEILVLMKLRAARAQDLADIEHLVRAGMDLAAVSAWLRAQAPEHLPVFQTLAQRASLARP